MLRTVLSILMPFVGTSLGACSAFFIKNKINQKINRIILGFSGGIMLAASIWSLILPSIEQSEHLNKMSFFPAALGICIGIAYLILTDKLIKQAKGKSDKSKLLIFAVTLHNIPEGMAVGVVFSALASGSPNITFASAFALALGIAIQNIPEGAVVSMPARAKGYSKTKSFIIGVLSGAVEPIGAGLTFLMSSTITSLLPYLLSFAAGAMIYVTINEIVPEAKDNKDDCICALSFAIGFLIMMILDVVM